MEQQKLTFEPIKPNSKNQYPKYQLVHIQHYYHFED